MIICVGTVIIKSLSKTAKSYKIKFYHIFLDIDIYHHLSGNSICINLIKLISWPKKNIRCFLEINFLREEICNYLDYVERKWSKLKEILRKAKKKRNLPWRRIKLCHKEDRVISVSIENLKIMLWETIKFMWRMLSEI